MQIMWSKIANRFLEAKCSNLAVSFGAGTGWAPPPPPRPIHTLSACSYCPQPQPGQAVVQAHGSYKDTPRRRPSTPASDRVLPQSHLRLLTFLSLS